VLKHLIFIKVAVIVSIGSETRLRQNIVRREKKEHCSDSFEQSIMCDAVSVDQEAYHHPFTSSPVK
jgi:hypothetical protein